MFLSREDPRRRPRIVSRLKMRYLGGADAAEDRPAHVRAASSIVRFHDELIAVQDDALFLARIDLATFTIRDAPLPRGPGGARLFDDARGNKSRKLDLEAAVVVAHHGDELLVAFGSGSKPTRETILMVRREGDAFAARAVDAHELYRAMRAEVGFSGSELNLEGVVRAGPDLLFLQRGNGADRPPLRATNATARVDATALLAHLEEGAPCPPLREVRPHDLGRVEGARLTFTDATWHRDELFFVAAAEASPDANDDGPVEGVALGVLESGSHSLLLDENGARARDKIEGIVSGPRGELFGVVDRDDPDAPAELLQIEWPS